MQRDMELVRQILIDISESKVPTSLVQSEKSEEYLYHLDIMQQAGLITYSKEAFYDGKVYIEKPRLTWTGNDYLEALFSNKIWDRTKKIINEKGMTLATVPIDVIIELAKLQFKNIFGT